MNHNVMYKFLFATVITTILGCVSVYAVSNLYGVGGSVSTPTVGQIFTQGNTVNISFSSQFGSNYKAYVCPQSVDPSGLTGGALDTFFVTNSSICTLAFSGVATGSTVSAVYSGTTVGSYKLHVIDGCAPIVADTTPPVVTLVGSGSITLFVGDTYTESGATWVDNQDGNGVILTAFSGSVDTSTVGTYTLSYTYTDTSGNIGNTVTRTVIIIPVPDTVVPIITLTGDDTIYINAGDPYIELGATWTDNIDGSGNIVSAITGTVDNNNPGTYTLTYTYTDVAGNPGNTVTRTVYVNGYIIINAN